MIGEQYSGYRACRWDQRQDDGNHRKKKLLGRPLMLALDLLVAGDLVKTVSLEPTLNNVETLGLLVLVRTFLSWSLAVEMEGHWPWQGRSKSGNPDRTAPGNPEA